MVAVARRSTILATVCSMAVLSNLSDAAVVPSTRSTLSHRASRQDLKEPAQAPTVPLPAAAMATKDDEKTSHAKNSEHGKMGSRRHKSKKAKSHHKLASLDLSVPDLTLRLTSFPKREQFLVQDASSQAAHFMPHERRSILITGPQSAAYLVSHARRAQEGDQQQDVPAARHSEADSEEGVLGSIDIMGTDPNTPKGKKVASLSLETSTTNASSSTFVLNASTASQTQFLLVPMMANTTSPSNNSTSSTDADVKVKLKVSVFDPSLMGMEPFCATFDPCPAEPESLTVQACDDNVTEHKSQVFNYNEETGVIKPMWYNSEDDGKTETESTDPKTTDMPGVASVTSANPSNSTDPSSANATLAVRDMSTAAPQSVTLMFTPAAPAVPYQEKADAIQPSTSVVTETTTVTTTATTTQSVAAQEISTTSTSAATSVTSTAVTTQSVAVQEASTSPSTTTSSSTMTPLSTASVESASTTEASTSATLTSSTPSPTSASTELKVQVVAADTTTSAAATPSSSSLAAEDVASSIMAGYTSTNGINPRATSSVASSSGQMRGGSSSSVTTGTDMSEAPEPMMTPVSAAYQWMFTARRL